MTWLILSIGAAIGNSLTQAAQKMAVARSGYSKIAISFLTAAPASLILFLVSYFIIGVPEIDGRFWQAALVTAALNVVAFPIMLRAYQLGEFSSVYSMILLTPVFLLGTSFLFIGEIPSLVGVIGVVLTIVGLAVVTRDKHVDHPERRNFKKANWLGVCVAAIWSVSINFDKLSASYSDPFFGPAFVLALMSFGYATYLLFTRNVRMVKGALDGSTRKSRLQKMGLLFVVGAALALSYILHNSALLAGYASYTIAIKRVGVLFAVLWGWLFFKEKYVAKKLIGSAIAIVGVLAIILS